MKNRLVFTRLAALAAISFVFSSLPAVSSIAVAKNGFKLFCSYSFNIGTLNLQVQGVPAGAQNVQYEIYLSGTFAHTFTGLKEQNYIPIEAVTGSGYAQGVVLAVAYPINKAGKRLGLPNVDKTYCDVY